MRLNAFIMCLGFWSIAIGGSSEAVCQTQTDTSDGDQSQAKQQRTRELILKFFPKLDKDSVEGWVDSYSSMNEPELRQLLQQRQVLGQGMTGFSGLQLDLPKFEIEKTATARPSPSGKTQDNPIDRAMTIIQRNLSGLLVAGHHSRTFCFTYSGSSDGHLGPLALQSSWDFATGKKHFSGRPLDLAIMGHNLTMFRLEPGCVLTRSGHFVRFADGRIGQKVGNMNLALSPEVRVSDPEMSVKIRHDGAVLSEGGSPKPSRLGQIIAVQIKDVTRLKSTNGVYFTVSEEDQATAFTLARHIALEAGTLELSNVDASRQLRLQKDLQLMLGASQ